MPVAGSMPDRGATHCAATVDEGTKLLVVPPDDELLDDEPDDELLLEPLFELLLELPVFVAFASISGSDARSAPEL